MGRPCYLLPVPCLLSTVCYLLSFNGKEDSRPCSSLAGQAWTPSSVTFIRYRMRASYTNRVGWPCSLSTVYYLLSTAYCLLPTAYCLLFAAFQREGGFTTLFVMDALVRDVYQV